MQLPVHHPPARRDRWVRHAWEPSAPGDDAMQPQQWDDEDAGADYAGDDFSGDE